jgi:hypothetical protein
MEFFLPPMVATSTAWKAAVTVADFQYEIVLPDGSIRQCDVDARIPIGERVPFDGQFEDAVALALHQQEWLGPVVEGDARPQPLHQAIGIQMDPSGKLFLGRVTGSHQDRLGALFLDGTFFADNARSLKIVSHGMVSDGMRLIGVVGQHEVADLRTKHTATFSTSKVPSQA